MKTTNLIAITCFLVALVILSCTSAVPETTTVMQYRGNAQLTGLSKEPPVHALRRVQFSFKTEGPVRMMPTACEGVLYFGSGDGRLYAIDAATGKERWHFQSEGAVNCTPAVCNGLVYFNSRDGHLYALDVRTGKQRWGFNFGKDLEYKNGWDYYLSSPTISDDLLYTGSGNGNIYAFRPDNGELVWSFATGARVRTACAAGKNYLISGSMNGYVFALDKKKGVLKWKFATKGVNNRFEDFGFDATAILSSPSVGEGIVLAGARDGILYAIDEATGKEKWRYDHDGSWVLGTAIKDGMAYASSGSSAFVQALDLHTGKEKWRFNTMRACFSALALAGDMIYFDDYLGNLYAANNQTGEKAWVFPMGRRSFSSPLVYNGKIYCSSDDGILYALEGGEEPNFKPASPSRKIVYWEAPKTDSSYTWFQNGVDLYIRDYLKNAGYEVADADGLKRFLQKQIDSAGTSVVVFANNEIPYSLAATSTRSLLRRYLDAKGKIVFLGPNPAALVNNGSYGIIYNSINFLEGPEKVFGIRYKMNGNINMSPVYQSNLTNEGRACGLRNWLAGSSPLLDDTTGITILAKDEYGNPAAWIKSYGGGRGKGLLQIHIPKEVVTDLQPVRAAIEYGIEW